MKKRIFLLAMVFLLLLTTSTYAGIIKNFKEFHYHTKMVYKSVKEARVLNAKTIRDLHELDMYLRDYSDLSTAISSGKIIYFPARTAMLYNNLNQRYEEVGAFLDKYRASYEYFDDLAVKVNKWDDNQNNNGNNNGNNGGVSIPSTKTLSDKAIKRIATIDALHSSISLFFSNPLTIFTPSKLVNRYKQEKEDITIALNGVKLYLLLDSQYQQIAYAKKRIEASKNTFEKSIDNLKSAGWLDKFKALQKVGEDAKDTVKVVNLTYKSLRYNMSEIKKTSVKIEEMIRNHKIYEKDYSDPYGFYKNSSYIASNSYKNTTSVEITNSLSKEEQLQKLKRRYEMCFSDFGPDDPRTQAALEKYLEMKYTTNKAK